MMYWLRITVLLLVASVFNTVYAGTYSGGLGTEASPYLISTAQDLIDLGNTTADYSKYFKLVNDIDMNWRSFTQPIIAKDTDPSDSYFDGTRFTGNFNGNGHIISKFVVNSTYNSGLFGYIDYQGVVMNLGITNASISGTMYIGGLCGNNEGSIENCFTSCSVSGSNYVGGLCGNGYGYIRRSYSSSTVTGYYNTGGINGMDYSWYVTNSYFYKYGSASNGAGTALNDQQITNKASFVGFDFENDTSDGTADIWTISDGCMPTFAGQNSPGSAAPYLLDKLVTTLSGSGYPEDPFVIANLADLMEFRNNTTLRIGYYILTDNIDISGTIYPEPLIAWPFKGSFNGNEHTISGLSINGSVNLGLFGRVLGGEIYNLGMEDVYISGTIENIGALAGYANHAQINGCYATGIMLGNNNVGGLCGTGYNTTFNNCYTDVTIEGVSYLGGLAGYGSSSFYRCYATGSISGSGGYQGGLCGSYGYGSYCYSYKYCGPKSNFGIALDDEQLLNKSSFYGFDFAGSSNDGTADVWIIEEGYMPRLSWQAGPGYSAPYRLANIETTLAGSGYPDDPFIIASYDDIQEFRNNTDLRIGDYWLLTDIDLGGNIYTDPYILGSFYGNLYGNNFAIYGLNLNSNASYVGFFSSTLSGTIKDLALPYVNIVGTGSYVGALSGSNSSTIENVHVSGSISGGSYVGSLFGNNSNGNISDCSFNGTIAGSSGYVGGLCGDTQSNSSSNCTVSASVSGSYYVGGLFGNNSSGNISKSSFTGSVTSTNYMAGGLCGMISSCDVQDCYAKASVTSRYYIGGMFGYCSYSDVSNCYVTGSVTGEYFYIGGLCGIGYPEKFSNIYISNIMYYPTSATEVGAMIGYCYGYSENIYNCFWDAEVNTVEAAIGYGETDAYGIIGLSTAEMKTPSTYTSAGWDFTNDDGDVAKWRIGNNSYPQLYWQPGPDIDGNRMIDILDFSWIAKFWLNENGMAGPADMDKSGVVGIGDLEILAQQWLTCHLNTENLLAYWNFDTLISSAAKDSSIYGRNGSVKGNITCVKTIINNGYYFDGSGDYVSAPVAFSPSDGPFSACMWVQGGGANQNIICQTNGTGSGRIWLGVSVNNTLQTVIIPSGGSTLASTNTWDTTDWHHVAVTWDGSKRRIFTDGELIAEDEDELGQLEFADGPIYIGAHKGLGASNYWKGYIDDVRIYNVALTQEEILNMFESE